MIKLDADNINRCLNDCVLFDIETTGLDTENDQIIEISALKIESGDVADEFSTLVNPGVHIPYMATSINGITDDMVADAPDTKTALKDFLDFAGDAVLTGHNIDRFDLMFIRRDVTNLLGREIRNEHLDTLVIARRFLPHLASRSLESLASFYGISYEGAHRALADCRINYDVFLNLAHEAQNPCREALGLKVCPRCGNVLKLRNGKFGEFYGCRSFPDCRYTEDAGAQCR